MNEKINQIEKPTSNIEIIRQTADQELENLVIAIMKINWYEKQGYKIDYSHIGDPVFEKLKDEILNEVQDKESFGNEFKQIVEKFIKRAIELGCDKKISEVINDKSNLDRINKTENAIKAKKDLITQGLERFIRIKGFEKFDKYIVNLKVINQTQGQYGINDWKGNIYIKAFKNDSDLENIQILCLHEMFHAGIEESIIKKYDLKHWEKERIVDLVISLVLPDICPNYKLQEKGEKKLDNYINKDTVYNLPAAIEKYLEENRPDYAK